MARLVAKALALLAVPVYVSCSPSTLARGAGILVTGAGYVLRKAGVVNMFPHTSHVESMAVFDLPEQSALKARS